jgi:hypothetical protein
VIITTNKRGSALQHLGEQRDAIRLPQAHVEKYDVEGASLDDR